MATLLNQKDVQARFDLAVQEGVSPCLWIPPHWKDLETSANGKVFLSTSRDLGWFEEASAKAAMEERLVKGKAKDANEPSDLQSPPVADSWINAFADTTHLDETEFSSDDRDKIAAKLTGDQVLTRLDRIVGRRSLGMQRLARIFEWVLYRATVLMGELNFHLQREGEYDNEARMNYINFLRDLDDHEPEKGPKQTPLEKRENRRGRPESLDVSKKESASGYGRSIKWTCIDPVIHDGLIKGTRIVAKWNPHISSSGIAIPHQ
jgi:hypothetical protein